MNRRLQAPLVLLAGALLLGVLVGVVATRVLRPVVAPSGRDTALLLKEIQNLGELVTVRYVVEQTVIAEDAAWYGDNRVILLAHGIVKAGVDLEDLAADAVRVDGRRLRLRLPRPRLTDTYLDDTKTQVIERTTGLLRRFDKGLEQQARKEAVLRFRDAAFKAGILKDAEAQARAQLGALARRLGFEAVEFD